MPNNYLQQTSTLSAVLPGVIPPAQQSQNQLSSIITDITNLYHAVNGLLGNGTTGSSWFQNQSVITAQRALNTPYQNTSGLTMMVNVSVSTAVVITAYSDSTQAATTELYASQQGVSFMVLNNNYYRVTSGGTLAYWTETA